MTAASERTTEVSDYTHHAPPHCQHDDARQSVEVSWDSASSGHELSSSDRLCLCWCCCASSVCCVRSVAVVRVVCVGWWSSLL